MIKIDNVRPFIHLSSAFNTGEFFQPHLEFMCSHIKDDSHNLGDLFSMCITIKSKEAGGEGVLYSEILTAD